MRRFLGTLSALIALLGLMTASAMGAANEPRFALVIGNEAYPASIGRLENTHEDADRVASALEAAGFSVDRRRDLTKAGTNAAIDDFLIRLESNPGAVGFLYYSGHGTSATLTGQGRVNLLIPVRAEDEAPIESRSQLVRSAVRLDNIIDALAETKAKAIFVAFDACQDEFAFSETKGPDKGFGVVSARPGMLIAFATAAGSTAPDDGLFSRSLAEQIVKPGKIARYAIFDAVASVADKRSTRDQPFTAAGRIPDDVCFIGCANSTTAPPPEQIVSREPERGIPAIEQAVFDAANSPCEYKDFAETYPGSALAPLARRRAEDCGKSAAAATPVSSSTPPAAGAPKGYLDGGALPRVTGATSPTCPSMSQKACSMGLFPEMKRVANDFWSGNRKSVLDLAKRRCNEGVVDYCLTVAAYHQFGLEGYSRDLNKAAKIMEDVCNAGLPEACATYGSMMFDGSLLAQNTPRAVSLMNTACQQGSGTGCLGMGIAHVSGMGAEVNLFTATVYLQQACGKLVSPACYALATMSINMGDSITAAGYLQQGCAIGTGDPWTKQSCRDAQTLQSSGYFYPVNEPPGLLK